MIELCRNFLFLVPEYLNSPSFSLHSSHLFLFSFIPSCFILSLPLSLLPLLTLLRSSFLVSLCYWYCCRSLLFKASAYQ